jgi:SAM-dependent methyltransferase
VSRTHIAAEQRPFDVVMASLPDAEAYARTVLARLHRIAPLPRCADVLDVGAAQGLFLVGCTRLGHRAIGVEPWRDARRSARQLGAHIGMDLQLFDGVAERLPFPDATFDVVRANSVVEHVTDPAETFKEAHRVLKPGGVFWFLTASSLCPVQNEIRRFPAFSWYPEGVKLAVMNWAKVHRPDLIGHTTRPAIHWFTPRKARRMLREAGFGEVHDRWDLRLTSESGPLYGAALGLVRMNGVTKFLADVVVPDCAYAAVKPRA